MTKYTDDNSNFGANGPFFHIIRQGLNGLANGEDYFDLLADDVVFDYVISLPGYPRHVEGRQNIIDLYRGYDDYMKVDTADNLRVYRDLQSRGRRPRVPSPRRIRTDRTSLRQPLRLHHHDREPQGRPLARLPRPHRHLRSNRVAPHLGLIGTHRHQ